MGEGGDEGGQLGTMRGLGGEQCRVQRSVDSSRFPTAATGSVRWKQCLRRLPPAFGWIRHQPDCRDRTRRLPGCRQQCGARFDQIRMTRSATLPAQPQDQEMQNLAIRQEAPGLMVAQAFLSAASASMLRPLARASAINLLQRALPRGEMDLVRGFAAPLSLIVLGRLIGLPSPDRSRLEGWCEAVESACAGEALPVSICQDMLETLRKVGVKEGAARQWASPGRITRQCPMSDEDLAATMQQVIVSARLNVLHLIAKGGLKLLQGRAQRDWLLRDPENRIEVALLEALGDELCWQSATPVARMEAEVALAALVLRAPDVRLAAPSESFDWHRDPWGHRPSEVRLAFRRTS